MKNRLEARHLRLLQANHLVHRQCVDRVSECGPSAVLSTDNRSDNCSIIEMNMMSNNIPCNHVYF